MIGQINRQDLRRALAGVGVGLTLGPYEFRIRSPLRKIADAIHVLQAHRPFRAPVSIPDFTIDFQPGFESLRRSVICSVDGAIWHSWPGRLTVAAMEWITSWCFFRSPAKQLAIHGAAAVHPNSGQAMIFPGLSGAGKSTLASTLMMKGWTLLSDEISLIDLEDLTVYGLGRPTILKGKSLELIGDQFGAQAVFGPREKILEPPSAIAHLQPTVETVRASGNRYAVSAFVFPRRDDSNGGSRLMKLPAKDCFVAIGQLGINYRPLGEQGFHAALELSRTRPAFALEYRDAYDAESVLRCSQELEGTERRLRSSSVATIPRVAATDVGHIAAQRSNVPVKHSGSGARAESFDLTSLVRRINEAMLSVECCREWSADLWGELLPLANHLELLPQLAARWGEWDGFGSLPQPVRNRVNREIQASDFTRVIMRYEMGEVCRLFSGLVQPLVLLKGCSYLLADEDWARGRRTSDVDLLVDESIVDVAAEVLLRHHYEVDEGLSDKDVTYYRRWLHELPPIKHGHRKLELDLHFRLLPVGDPNTFDVSGFIARAVEIPGTGFHRLDPVDRVLHSAINLGRTGEFRRAFRDMWDIRQMVQASLKAGQFDWQILSERAREVGVQATVARVMLLAEQWIGLELPPTWCEFMAGKTPERIRRSRLYRLMCVGALPDGTAYRSWRRRSANWMLEHYPLPKFGTWVDPLTWTKRVRFIQGK